MCNCTVATNYPPNHIIQHPMTNLPSVNQEITITRDDAAWVLANAFLILTMQTGFGMLEAGSVSSKNVANIMIKNVVDVTLGGITYWSFGYALSYGEPSNAFCGYGDFFFSAPDQETMGQKYTHYVFQFSFATASTTIVSGAVAERMKLSAYMVFSAVNTIIYCIPASWVWRNNGWLNQIGFFDFAGGCVVHITGGASALAAAMILGPRMGRFTSEKKNSYGMSSPVTALTGTFMLWWAWLAFNCGSSNGIQDNLWKTAAKVGVVTLNGSIGGSFMGMVLSVLMNWEQKIIHIPSIITSVLGGLVSVTASCAVVSPAEALLIGSIGGALATIGIQLLEKLGVDDPVGAVPVHLFAGLWGTVAVGLFGQKEFAYLNHNQGIFKGGGFKLLGIQMLGSGAIMVWTILLTAASFFIMKHTIGIRMKPEEEILGADWVQHHIPTENFGAKLEKTLGDISIKHEEINSVAAKVITAFGNYTHCDSWERLVARFPNHATVSAMSSLYKQTNGWEKGKQMPSEWKDHFDQALAQEGEPEEQALVISKNRMMGDANAFESASARAYIKAVGHEFQQAATVSQITLACNEFRSLKKSPEFQFFALNLEGLTEAEIVSLLKLMLQLKEKTAFNVAIFGDEDVLKQANGFLQNMRMAAIDTAFADFETFQQKFPRGLRNTLTKFLIANWSSTGRLTEQNGNFSRYNERQSVVFRVKSEEHLARQLVDIYCQKGRFVFHGPRNTEQYGMAAFELGRNSFGLLNISGEQIGTYLEKIRGSNPPTPILAEKSGGCVNEFEENEDDE